MFFFSSRRRHTRSLRDWSSDVCSSDLSEPTACTASRCPRATPPRERAQTHSGSQRASAALFVRSRSGRRSEERRVGIGSGFGLSKETCKKQRYVVCPPSKAAGSRVNWV